GTGPDHPLLWARHAGCDGIVSGEEHPGLHGNPEPDGRAVQVPVWRQPVRPRGLGAVHECPDSDAAEHDEQLYRPEQESVCPDAGSTAGSDTLDAGELSFPTATQEAR